MTRDTAEYIMCNLGLEEFPMIGPRSYEEMAKLCSAFQTITGRAAKPVAGKRAGTYIPELGG